MILLRFGHYPKYDVWVVSSPTFTDADIQKRIAEILTKRGATWELKHSSFVSEDGRRSEGILMDVSVVKGLRMLRIHSDIRAIANFIQDLEIREHSYNDRSDSAELEVPAPAPEMLSEWPKAIATAVHEHIKTSFLNGKISPGTISCARELVLLASQWGAIASKEIVGLLLGRFYEPRLHFTQRNLSRELGKLVISIEENSDSVTWDLDGIASFANMVHEVTFASGASGDADVACWKRLIQAFLTKNWQGEFSCLGEVGFRCDLPCDPSYPTRPEWFDQRFDHRERRHSYWVLLPVRERILSYAEDPGISLDEFLDLASLPPPQGYRVFRRLSNTSAFKVVYRAQDAQSDWVALKRYKSWDSDTMRRLLSRLGMTIEDVIRKDSLTRWMGKIRHTHILPCMVVRNENGELFFVEPLLDTTLDRITVGEPKEAILLIRQVCEAIAYLHAQGLVHGDIKPDNIGLERGNAALLDFGIASFYSVESRPRDNPGSIKTRAPELFSEATVPTFASDVWALGATLMALASAGEYPFLRREEVEHLAPAGDPERVALEKTIRGRIEECRRNSSHLENRIRSAVPQVFHPILEPVLHACQMEPAHRPNAKKLVDMFGQVMDAL